MALSEGAIDTGIGTNEVLVMTPKYGMMENMLRIELNQLLDSLPKLIEGYSAKSSESGNNSGLEILRTIKTLKQVYVSLLEIYDAECNLRKDQLFKLSELQFKSEKISERIEWINNESEEIEVIKVLNGQLDEVDREIETLELKLAAVKLKKSKLLSSKLQAESTLQSDLNRFTSSLENIHEKELKTIEHIIKLGGVSEILPSNGVIATSKEYASSESYTHFPNGGNLIKHVLERQIIDFQTAKDAMQMAYDGMYYSSNRINEILECVNAVEVGLVDVSKDCDPGQQLDEAVTDVLSKGESSLKDIINENVAPHISSSYCPSNEDITHICRIELEAIRAGILMVSSHSNSLPPKLAFPLTKQPNVGTSNIHAIAKQL